MKKDDGKKKSVTLRGGALKTQGFKCDMIVYEEPERERISARIVIYILCIIYLTIYIGRCSC